MRASAIFALAGLLMTAAVGEAQVTRPRPAAGTRKTQPKVHVNIGAGLATGGPDFDQTFTTEINAEESTFDIPSSLPDKVFADIGGWVELTHMFGAGVSFSVLSRDAEGTVEGTIANPFYFGQRRTLSGEFSNLSSKEVSIHFDAVAAVPLGKALLVSVFAGPSVIRVEQSLITGITYSETYPYDTATFEGFETERAAKAGPGFNAGADVTIRLTPSIGIGAMLRYVTGTVELPSTVHDAVKYKINAARISAGVRLTF